MHTVRVVELVSKEVYVDVNDLIIEFLLKADSAQHAAEKDAYKDIVRHLTSIRDKALRRPVGTQQEHTY